MVEAGEEWVRSLGFVVFRVRHLARPEGASEGAGPRARVQIAPAEMGKLSAVSESLEMGLKAVGYGAVEIDPAGYLG